MTPVNVARRRNIFRRWLRYDGMKHKFVGVKVNPADYRKIGESGKLEFHTLKDNGNKQPEMRIDNGFHA